MSGLETAVGRVSFLQTGPAFEAFVANTREKWERVKAHPDQRRVRFYQSRGQRGGGGWRGRGRGRGGGFGGEGTSKFFKDEVGQK